MQKIVVDGFGGDNAPSEIVAGVVQALSNHPEIKITITGDQNILKEEFSKHKEVDYSRLEIVHTTQIISNNESPTEAIKTKKDSSLVVAFNVLKDDPEAIGIVSAGSTGAVLTGATLIVRRMKGLSRPALCPVLPTVDGKNVLLIDCGANMDAKPMNLAQFAIMGTAYAKNILGVENPRVALLNVGVEDHKGNELCHKTFPILQKLPINFVGNMEARDALTGQYDVIVTDGFAGNVLLKTVEGTAKMVGKMLKQQIKAHFISKIGAPFMLPAIKGLKSKLDYEGQGGSIFLGCKKIVVKSHGSSKATSISASINQVIEMNNANVYEKIEKDILDTEELIKGLTIEE